MTRPSRTSAMNLRHLPLLLLVLAGAARAELTLRAPAAPVAAGAEFEIVLLITNPGATACDLSAPAELQVAAVSGSRHITIHLHRAGLPAPAQLPVPAGGFQQVAFRGTLPEGFAGLVVLDASRAGAGRTVVEAVAPTNLASTAPAAVPAPALDSAEAAPTTLPPRRDLGLSPHEPIYFSVGGKGGLNARFQLSFKFRPIGPSDDRLSGRGFWEDVYLGYTQTSLWDLHSLSKPFTDSSYRPSLFYHRYDIDADFLGGRLGLAAGLEHESNGKGANDSRSINIAFARPTLRWGDPEGWRLVVAPKFYGYLEKSENDDIQRFRGYGDFLFALEHPRSLKLAATFRAGTSGHGSVLVDASYPFARINDVFPLGLVHGYLHLQFFEGWGETLLHYDERAETQFRAGFMAVR